MVGIPTLACLHFCRPSIARWMRTAAPSGRRKGAANPISSSLAHSLHENQCGSDCAVKKRAPCPGKAARAFGDAGPRQDASAAEVVDKLPSQPAGMCGQPLPVAFPVRSAPPLHVPRTSPCQRASYSFSKRVSISAEWNTANLGCSFSTVAFNISSTAMPAIRPLPMGATCC